MKTSDIISLASVIVAIVSVGSMIYFKNKANSKDDVSIIAIMKNNLDHLTVDIKDIKDGVKEINKKLNFNSEEIRSLQEQVKTLFKDVEELKYNVKDLEHERSDAQSR